MKFKVGDELYFSGDKGRDVWTVTYVNKLRKCYEIRRNMDQTKASDIDFEWAEARYKKISKLEKILS